MTDNRCTHGSHHSYCQDCIEAPQPPKPKPPKPKRATTTPRSADDPIAALSGEFDVSMPVYEIEPYLHDDWLVLQGYPHSLRAGGWVYLRNDSRLRARAKAVRVEWRDDRPIRTGEGDPFEPGLVLIIDPATWEADFDVHLGDLADSQIQGYRYLTTEDGTVQHMVGGQPVGNPQPIERH